MKGCGVGGGKSVEGPDAVRPAGFFFFSSFFFLSPGGLASFCGSRRMDRVVRVVGGGVVGCEVGEGCGDDDV